MGRRRHPRTNLAAATAATVPGLVVRLGGVSSHLGPLTRSAVYGIAIVGASLLLTWAAELAQLDLSPALAIGGLALVAVLPEYVVGAVFASRGGHALPTLRPRPRPPPTGRSARWAPFRRIVLAGRGIGVVPDPPAAPFRRARRHVRPPRRVR